jgi:hypothetical protein
MSLMQNSELRQRIATVALTVALLVAASGTARAKQHPRHHHGPVKMMGRLGGHITRGHEVTQARRLAACRLRRHFTRAPSRFDEEPKDRRAGCSRLTLLLGICQPPLNLVSQSHTVAPVLVAEPQQEFYGGSELVNARNWRRPGRRLAKQRPQRVAGCQRLTSSRTPRPQLPLIAQTESRSADLKRGREDFAQASRHWRMSLDGFRAAV